jgi:hypothetical protein
MTGLVERFLPISHDAPITAAAYDPWSGARASADETGIVRVTRGGESQPAFTLQENAPVRALAFARGGALLGLGTDGGAVAVLRLSDGHEVFREERSGERGRVRAMGGVAVSPEGARLASIAADGLLRIWDLTRGERQYAWQGFGGTGVDFDDRGMRVLCLDAQGQPRLVDLLSNQALPMDRLQAPAEHVCFSLDGTHVVAAGASGISVLRVLDGVLVHSFAARGGSGLLGIAQRPDGAEIAAVSQRSVHVFSIPELQPVGSGRHGAPATTGAVVWDQEGWKVGGADGTFHDGQTGVSDAGPVTAVAGFGPVRAVAHGNLVVAWSRNRRTWRRELGQAVSVLHVDRDGQYVVAGRREAPLAVVDAAKGQVLFEGGPGSEDPLDVAVGGNVVACLLRGGGLRWWDLARNTAFELPWPTAMALSHGGTWLAAVTPRGAIKILDPRTGREGLAELLPGAETPTRLLAFVNRRPDLLVVDDDRVLSHYDLTQAGSGGGSGGDPRVSRHGALPQVAPRDVLQFETMPERLWGLSGGRLAALRMPAETGASLVYVDLHAQGLLGAHDSPHPGIQLDVEDGTSLTPARGAAVLERAVDGSETRVLRALGDAEWIAFGPRGILDASPGAATRLGS